MRVVAGMHRGAMLRLRKPATLGSGGDSDILLVDPEVREHHAEIRRMDGHWCVIDLDSGLPISAFETAQRGRFVRTRHAVGGAQIVLTQQMEQAPSSGAPRPALPRSLARAITPLLCAIAVAAGALLIVQLVTPAAASVAPGTRSLASDGWPDVESVASANQPLLVRGYVDDAASLARLRRWLDTQQLSHATVNVRVGAELANRVRDALAEPSLRVDYMPGGTVRVQGTSDKLATRERLRRIAADLSGSVRIDDRVAFVEHPDLTPKKYVLPIRIVDVRPGSTQSMGSFGSDNGARFFAGAVLPDGSEVVAINEDSIEFSMAGRRINYPLK